MTPRSQAKQKGGQDNFLQSLLSPSTGMDLMVVKIEEVQLHLIAKSLGMFAANFIGRCFAHHGVPESRNSLARGKMDK